MFNPQLLTFVCVADCGSFNKAAERLYISPPSVMKQVNALEKHLELILFERTNQGIRLTPTGWDHSIPYGLLYAKEPSEDIVKFLNFVRTLSPADRRPDQL